MAYQKEGKSTRKVLVIGDIMLDKYVIGRVRRMCPEAPVPVIECAETWCYPGGAANVAANIKSMGGQVILAGVIGKDEEGEFLRKILKRKGIPAVLGVDAGRPTTVKKRIGTREQLIVRLDRELAEEISQGIFHDILKVVAVLLEDVKLVTVSDYGKGVVTRKLISAISDICKSRNIPIFVDPKGPNFSKYSDADIVKPNFHSLEILYGKDIRDIDDMQKAVDMVFSATGCKACIVTWGCYGAILFRSAEDWIHYPCRAEWNTAYISGAGDVFLAALAMAGIQGMPLEAACIAANEAASAAAGRIGTMVADAATWEKLSRNNKT
ncbi:MAG: bifunctional heptose 7-phosphate kinase/heptose 1-phosphate adenyltransferase [Caldicoprobacterales bacterium]